MASVKIISLVIRTLSKPIATRLKETAQQHGRFRDVCVTIAQSVHRFETRAASSSFLGASKVQVRPLSEAKAIQQGAAFLSETFLFSVAAALIVGESLRSRASNNSRRDDVKAKLEDLDDRLLTLSGHLAGATVGPEVSESAGDQRRLRAIPPPSLLNDTIVLRAQLALRDFE